jgi:membrane protease YdiL (CAAX protease family)
MGPESVKSQDTLPSNREATPSPAGEELKLDRPEIDELNWVFFGPNGLRAGWSILLFGVLLYFLLDLFQVILSFLVLDVAHLRVYGGTALNTILGEGKRVAALFSAVLIVAAVERRRLTDYNLGRAKRAVFLFAGAAAGFAAVSVLIGVLSEGGWLHFGPVALAGHSILEYALLWGIAFALVGLFEEGAFRCYLLSTLERGVNFWWALAVVGGLCVYLIASPEAHGSWGVHIVALAGLFPCLFLQLSKSPRRGFWQAAWATSAGFGFIHTYNNGENWTGILAAATIGFVFCVSVRVTGSAWWAIGCHASWDWAESYFYGTADSGFYARGHLLTSIPAGSALWSGGAAGPEGSVLVFPTILLLLAAIVVVYRRRAAPATAARPPTVTDSPFQH